MSIFSASNAVKFAEVGETHTIVVDEVTDEPDRFAEDGGPDTVTVIRGIDEDGDECALYIRKRQLGYAIGVAVKEQTGKMQGPARGSKLTIKRTEDGEASKPGYAAPHQFVAKYEPPAAGQKTFGGEEDPF